MAKIALDDFELIKRGGENLDFHRPSFERVFFR